MLIQQLHTTLLRRHNYYSSYGQKGRILQYSR
jgi:hypothetical protein